jgi:glycosyltransferase involved in cell wall biosynthesis
LSDASVEHRDEHLVCVATSAELGGAETSLLTLLRALRERVPRWRITVVLPDNGPVRDCCRQAGIDTLVVPYPPGLAELGEPNGSAGAVAKVTRAAAALWPYERHLRRALTELRPTIVHSNGIKAHVATAISGVSRARLVWHVHEYVGSRRVTARLLRMLSRKPAAVVVNSDSVRRDVQHVLGRQDHVWRVHNAVDLSVFCPSGEVLDLARASALTSDAGLVRIGLVATFGRWKGHEVFLDAIAQLSKDLPVRGYVIGGPVYQTSDSQRNLDELRTYATSRGLAGRVGFTGHIANVSAAMRSLDVVVHASTRPEPFGMVIAEGMATARAVVAVRDGGAQELFEDEVDALGHRMGDAGDLARQLTRLVSDAALRASLARAARETAQRRFSPARMAAEFLEVYAA